MHITTPPELTDFLWEGALEPPQAVRAAELPRASIGAPAQWADGQLLGEKWQPPVGGHRYHLVRLAFSLRPEGRAQVTSAEFHVGLSAQGQKRAIAFDAFPREQLQEQALAVTLGLGPDFKLGAAEASLAKAETTIDFGYALPIIRVDGLQESNFRWIYAAHPKHPLAGSRQMYVVIQLPPDMPGTLATLELTVTLEDRLGPLRVSTPATARTRLRWVVGESRM